MQAPVDEDRLMAKITWRLIPFLCFCFLVAFLDRVNVGFAALTMQADLKFSDAVYASGAGIFFIGYFLFEVPSNLILEKVGARLWIARIMIVWGLISSGMMFVTSPGTFYLLRFLLGAAEAGFFPGIILYLTYWFPTARRSRTVALFMTAPPLSGIVGGPLSGFLLDHHPASMQGWQWLFLIEGIPSVLTGIAVLFLLPNGPRSAKWISPAEADWLSGRLDAERAEREKHHAMSVWRALYHPRVLLLCLVYFLIVIGAYGFDFFMPKILQKAFAGASLTRLGLLSAIPPLFTVFVMVLWGRRSDRLGERRWHVVWPAVWAALGLTVASFDVVPPLVALAAVAIAVSGRWSCIPPFWGLPTAFLSGTAAAGGLALINAIGNLGGYVGPKVMGFMKTATGSYSAGLRLLAGAYILGALLVLSLRTRQRATVPERLVPPKVEAG
jgi:MFS transporter, ACS family, tartrate transporter